MCIKKANPVDEAFMKLWQIYHYFVRFGTTGNQQPQKPLDSCISYVSTFKKNITYFSILFRSVAPYRGILWTEVHIPFNPPSI